MTQLLMTLSRHHVIALVGAGLTSAIAVSDAVGHGITGRNLVFAEGSGHPHWIMAGGLVHGVTYTALGWVVIAERSQFQSSRRLLPTVRVALLVSLGMLAAGFTLVDPLLQIARAPRTGLLATAWEWLVSLGFAGMIISCLVLGIVVLRHNPLGYGGRILRLLIPVVGATVLLSFVAPDWAHPGYVETVINFGLALIGVRAVAGSITRPRRPVQVR